MLSGARTSSDAPPIRAQVNKCPINGTLFQAFPNTGKKRHFETVRRGATATPVIASMASLLKVVCWVPKWRFTAVRTTPATAPSAAPANTVAE